MGELDKIYDVIGQLKEREGMAVDLLYDVGTFMSAHPTKINFKWDPFNLNPLQIKIPPSVQTVQLRNRQM